MILGAYHEQQRYSYHLGKMVKNLPAVQETRIWSLGRKGPPEKGVASHCSILARKIPWTEEPGGPQPRGSHGVDTTEQLSLSRSQRQRPAKFFITQRSHYRGSAGPSLAARWSRLCASTVGGCIRSLAGNEGPACHVVCQKIKIKEE